MNLQQIDDDTFEFELYNLLGTLDGHYTFRWRRDGSYVLKKHGGFANLTSYVPVEEEFREPTAAENEFLAPRVADAVNNARFYDSAHVNGHGARLVPGDRDIVYAHLIFDRRGETVNHDDAD